MKEEEEIVDIEEEGQESQEDISKSKIMQKKVFRMIVLSQIDIIIYNLLLIEYSFH